MKIAVIDFETDPFQYDRVPAPFAWGFYDGETYIDCWENDSELCVKKLIMLLESFSEVGENYKIYAHNGGRFDFMFMIEYMEGEIKIVNGRILEANLFGHVLRDSYAILPEKLSKIGSNKASKIDIDYSKMEKDVREEHKEEIMAYLKADNLTLYNAVVEFHKEFGDNLTIGGTAMRQLKTFTKFETANESFDKYFRQFYFGGRCQVFEKGIIEKPIKLYDIHSAYPAAMKNLLHPISTRHDIGYYINENTMFVQWEGENYNAVPIRTKTGIDFTVKKGTFFSSIHEFNVALEFNMIKVNKILKCINFMDLANFEDFVTHFYEARLKAIENGDMFLKLFYKLILNSAYGKFAQNPEKFEDSIILPRGEYPANFSEHDWIEEYVYNDVAIWSKPSNIKSYYNVATAASITGGARANLLRGIAQTTGIIYCDTDSIFTYGEFNGTIHATNLGDWDLEASGDSMAVAGKKMYVLYKDGEVIKKASKGVNLKDDEILRVAQGETVTYFNPAPKFKMDGRRIFIHRDIKIT